MQFSRPTCVLGWHRLGRCERRRTGETGCPSRALRLENTTRPPAGPQTHPPPPRHNPTHLPQATNRSHLPQALTPSPRPLPRAPRRARGHSRLALLIPPPPLLRVTPFPPLGARRESAKLFALRGARSAKLGALASPRPQPAGQGLQDADPIGTARCTGKHVSISLGNLRNFLVALASTSDTLPHPSLPCPLQPFWLNHPYRTVHFT